MWSSDLPENGTMKKEIITRTHILYEYDEPLLFIGKIGFINTLFKRIYIDNEPFGYLCCKISDYEKELLISNSISIRSIYYNNDCVIYHSESDDNELSYWHVNFDGIPEQFLPDKNVSLSHEIDYVPDFVPAKNSILTIKITGPQIREETIPFGVLKNIVDSTFNAVRHLLTPPDFIRSRSSTFDFLAAPIKYGSIIFSSGEGVADYDKINKQKRYKNITKREIDDSIEIRKNETYINGLKLEHMSKDNDLILEHSDEVFEFVQQIKPILPVINENIDSLDMAIFHNGSLKCIHFDKDMGKRIKHADAQTQDRPVTLSGKIFQINQKSHTFTMTTYHHRDVTCVLDDIVYTKLRSNPEFVIGAYVVARGKLKVRKRRDELKCIGTPEVGPLF